MERGCVAPRLRETFELRWLTEDRVRAIGLALCIAYVSVLFLGLGLRSRPALTSDFVAYQAAGRMALDGRAAEAYSWPALREVQAAILGGEPDGQLGWLNPPSFLFPVLAISELPYRTGWIVWIAGTAAVFGFAAWTILPRLSALAAAFAVPPVLFTAVVGQSGLLMAGLMGLALAKLERDPWRAGLALGLLSWKPQLGVVFPLLLAVGGHWTAFAVAGATVVAMAVASAVAFGVDAWAAFLSTLGGNASLLLNAGRDVLPRIQSLYGFALGLSVAPGLAMAVHGVSALLALVMALRMWAAPAKLRFEPRAVAAISAGFLITPYVWGYDLPALAMAVLFMVRLGLDDGFLQGERLLLVAVPAATGILMFVPLPVIGPVAWWTLLLLAWRRHTSGLAPVPGEAR